MGEASGGGIAHGAHLGGFARGSCSASSCGPSSGPAPRRLLGAALRPADRGLVSTSGGRDATRGSSRRWGALVGPGPNRRVRSDRADEGRSSRSGGPGAGTRRASPRARRLDGPAAHPARDRLSEDGVAPRADRAVRRGARGVRGLPRGAYAAAAAAPTALGLGLILSRHDADPAAARPTCGTRCLHRRRRGRAPGRARGLEPRGDR